MLVRSLRFKFYAFKENCTFICTIVKEAELHVQPSKNELRGQPSKQSTKLEIKRIATDSPHDLLKEESQGSTLTSGEKG